MLACQCIAPPPSLTGYRGSAAAPTWRRRQPTRQCVSRLASPAVQLMLRPKPKARAATAGSARQELVLRPRRGPLSAFKKCAPPASHHFLQPPHSKPCTAPRTSGCSCLPLPPSVPAQQQPSLCSAFLHPWPCSWPCALGECDLLTVIQAPAMLLLQLRCMQL